MDEAYQQHSPHSRRHNKSAASLNALSLAPLTSKLPLNDTDLPPLISTRSRSPKPISYIESRHVTPNTGILSHPTSRSSSRTGLAHRRKISLPQPRQETGTSLTKSKSSTHIHNSPDALQRPLHHKHKSGAVTPGPRPTHRHHHKSAASEDFAHLLFSPKFMDGKIDEDDWLLRTGSLLTHGARESKGQAWLVSRASSTSLTGQNHDSDSDSDEERKSQEDRISNFLVRRRESGIDGDDEFSPVTTRSFIVHSRSGSRYNSVFNSRAASRINSRANSRIHSRRGSKVGLALTPNVKDVGREEEEGYFDAIGGYGKPDFVGLDEEEEEEDPGARAIADELLVRRLAKTGTLGLGTWVEKLMGWSLFAVEDDNDDTEDENEAGATDTETEEAWERHKEEERQHWREMLEKEAKEQGVTLPPPPKGGDEGGWSDAAWLLSVATKVLL